MRRMLLKARIHAKHKINLTWSNGEVIKRNKVWIDTICTKRNIWINRDP